MLHDKDTFKFLDCPSQIIDIIFNFGKIRQKFDDPYHVTHILNTIYRVFLTLVLLYITKAYQQTKFFFSSVFNAK